MTKTFTPNDVLKASSNELSPGLKAGLQMALQEDQTLQCFADGLKSLNTHIPDLLEEPSERSVLELLAKLKRLETDISI